MKSRLLLLATNVLVLSAMSALADVRYVNVNSTSPTPPYTNWTTAATTIQDAVDAAVTGDQILVTNGVYQTGEGVLFESGFGDIPNRVAVTTALMVRSVNGAAVTMIDGQGGVRCVYLANGAALVGFTLTNGSAYLGGGVRCESTSAIVSNCVLTGSSAGGGGGASGGTLFNCTLNGNSADSVDGGGGGAYFSTLNNCTLTCNSSSGPGGGANSCTLSNCTLTGNSSPRGGGAAESMLFNCTLSGNSSGGADGAGGGAAESTLNNCTLTRNSASYGGGAYLGTLNNCTLTGNSTRPGGSAGGGAYLSTLNNCALSDNSSSSGGGVVLGTLNNCTLTGNSASYGGGAYNSTLNNCIVYYNSALEGDNSFYCRLSYSCTTPLPVGTGNISAEPQLASASHLSASSPCRGAGSAVYATGTDIDGETWGVPASIGCDEYSPGTVTGPLSVGIAATFTNVARGYPVGLVALIEGRPTASVWDFGDGLRATNLPRTVHFWTVPGDYAVVLRAYNESQPSGISATVLVHVATQPVHYVAAGNKSPLAPYASWAAAATNIQDAVDVARVTGALVLVTNGTYATGGRVVDGSLTSRVAVDRPLTLRSVNGPQFTVIQGYQVPGAYLGCGNGAIRCVYLTNGASLSGFTLTHGATLRNYPGDGGGGVWCESGTALVSNCLVVGNSAAYGGGAAGNSLSIGTLKNCTMSGNSAVWYGGGADGCVLNNCALMGNSATDGGGAAFGTLNNCTLTDNSASHEGGGVDNSTVNNCIVYYNSAPNVANYHSSLLSYCCTTPLPSNGIRNLPDEPRFVDYDGGNLRLQSDSPCINAGANLSAPAGPDLDGNPRIAGGTVDVGPYEFQWPRSLISYGWLQQYSLPTDGSVDYTDTDGDGLNNWQEWHAGTSPIDALSVLRLLSPASDVPGVVVSWQSVGGVNYFLERGTNLAVQPPFLPLSTNIAGQPGTTTFTDTNAIGPGPFFYRVGVQE